MSTDSIVTQVLPWLMALIMLGMGMALSVTDFVRVLRWPRSVLAILFAQLLLLPLTAFACVYIFDLPVGLGVGLVLLAACPGGTTSNLFSHLAKANVALSVTLTAVAGVFTVVTLPLWVNTALWHFSDGVPPWDFPVRRSMLLLFTFTLLPVALGMGVRVYFPSVAQRCERWTGRLALAFMVALTVGLILREHQAFLAYLAQAGSAVLALNALAVAWGWMVARLARLDFASSSTAVIEVGIQNSAMAIVVATTLLNDSEIAIPASLYSASMYLFGFAILWWRRRDRQQQPAQHVVNPP